MVRYHLLLPPDTATRRDLQDPKTIDHVVNALGGDPVLLELLQALAEADSLATGPPGVWGGDWKASLIGDLVRRCRLVMAGESLPQPDPIDPRYLALASDAGVHVDLVPGDGAHIHNVTMIAPDRRGLLSKAAGVLALNSLRVHSASVNSHEAWRSTRLWCHRISGRRRRPDCCVSSSSWRSTTNWMSSNRWNTVIGMRRATQGRGGGRVRRPGEPGQCPPAADLVVGGFRSERVHRAGACR